MKYSVRGGFHTDDKNLMVVTKRKRGQEQTRAELLSDNNRRQRQAML